MIVPQFRVQANATRLQVQLQELPEQLRLALKKKITQLTGELLADVRAREPVRTGRLRRMTRAYVDESRARDTIRGKVKVLRTGRASREGAAFGTLEYGSTGRSFQVRGYRRNGHSVSAYERHGTIRERRFLRGPAAHLLPRARLEIEEVIRRTMQNALKP
jgi:hypothetical protein